MSVQHANRGIVKKDLQLYYNREFVKSFRGESTTNIVSNTTDFSGVSYLQFPLNNHFKKPRWFFDSNLNFEVNQHLNFVVEYQHTLDYYRPLPIDNYYYSLSLGLMLKI